MVMYTKLKQRANRILQDMTRSLLSDQQLSAGFWAEALTYATHLYNRLVNKHNCKLTKFELYFGFRPSFDMIRVFGCTVYLKTYDILLKKWDNKASKGRFIGLDSKNPKSFKIWKSDTSSFVYSSNVVFDELLLQDSLSMSPPDLSAYKLALLDLLSDNPLIPSFTENLPAPTATAKRKARKLNVSSSTLNQEGSASISNIEEGLSYFPSDSVPTSSSTSSRYLLRENPKPTKRFSFLSRSLGLVSRCCSAIEALVPNTLRQARNCERYREEWAASIASEIKSLFDNDTFEIQPREHWMRPIGLKYVFKIKYAMDGSISRFKTRITALGNLQRQGIDFTEVFAPVSKYSTIRALLAFATHNDFFVHQMDVDTAFLYGHLPENERVYCKVPDDYPVPPHLSHISREHLVAKAKRSIYGLRQSPRVWFQTLQATMTSLGFIGSKVDPCAYSRTSSLGTVHVAVFVDDLLIVGSSISAIDEFKREMQNHYNMKDLGECTSILGLQISRSADGQRMYLHQAKYIHDILKRFGMLTVTFNFKSSRPQAPPLNPGLCKLLRLPTGANSADYDPDIVSPISDDIIDDMVKIADMDDSDEILSVPTNSAFTTKKKTEKRSYSNLENISEKSQLPYRELVGSLMYLMVSTRPDICFAVGYLARFMNCFDKSHFTAALQALKYIANTRNFGICYSRSAALLPIGFSDSDWASDIETRRSVTGYIFSMCGGPISWQSKLQRTVALSSAESEYMAACASAQEAVYLRQLLCDVFGLDTTAPTTLYMDNQSALAMAQNPINSARNKHIDIRYHFLRERVALGELKLEYVASADNLADVFTKPLAAILFSRFRDMFFYEVM